MLYVFDNIRNNNMLLNFNKSGLNLNICFREYIKKRFLIAEGEGEVLW